MALSPDDIRRRIVDAIADEHEPCYTGDSATWMSSIVTALATGRVLVGRTQSGEIVAAYPDGNLSWNGERVTLSLNANVEDPEPEFTALNPELQSDRFKRQPWAPQLEIPGDFFDVAYVFYALVGWQVADGIASAAMGCALCEGRCLDEVTTAGPGRLFVGCGCQDETWLDDVPSPERDEAEVAREEAGAWFSGAALGALGEAA